LSFELFGLDFGSSFDNVFGVERSKRDVGDGKPCTWASFEVI
jgi:hypothetical protein